MLPKELQTLIDNMNLPAPVTTNNTPTVESMVGDFNNIANTVQPQQNISLPQININPVS